MQEVYQRDPTISLDGLIAPSETDKDHARPCPRMAAGRSIFDHRGARDRPACIPTHPLQAGRVAVRRGSNEPAVKEHD
jgi:hypothetical protein